MLKKNRCQWAGKLPYTNCLNDATYSVWYAKDHNGPMMNVCGYHLEKIKRMAKKHKKNLEFDNLLHSEQKS